MRKIVLGLLTMFLMVITIPCQAWYHEDSSKWELITSNDDVYVYYNPSTLSFNRNSRQADVWMCLYIISEKMEAMTFEKFDFRNRKRAIMEAVSYDKDGDSIWQGKAKELTWEKIEPNTIGEEVLYFLNPDENFH